MLFVHFYPCQPSKMNLQSYSFSQRLSDLLLSGEHFISKVNPFYLTSGGVYVLRSYDAVGKPVTVPRVLDNDPDGILYIGKATLFSHRTGDMARSFSKDYLQLKHQTGERYWNNMRFQEKFPYAYLQVFMWVSTTPALLEKEFFIDYVSKYGDTPPLNRI
ncbi:hypothetical protein PSNIH1_11500 [Pantoea sp. PSNIH1]|nr:hypothetical protein PSNIH1_11500 [Pantoea sp. PSNIH1]